MGVSARGVSAKLKLVDDVRGDENMVAIPRVQYRTAVASPAHAQRFATEPGHLPVTGEMTCQIARNPAGKLLDFCTFDGGHDFSTLRLRHALERILAAP